MENIELAQHKKFVWLESDVADRVIHFDVWVCYFVSKILSVPSVRYRRIEIRPEDVVHGSRYIIAANHQSLVDTFVICSQFPVSVWRHMGTLRYFAARGLFRAPVLREFLMANGSFPARHTDRWPSGLEYGIRMLHKGKTVMIFPEGWRTVAGTGKAYRGVEALAHSHPHAMVVPVHIQWHVRWKIFRTFRIHIGAPFDGSKMSAQEILDRIYDLPLR